MDDLQFAVEETAIDKGDLEVTTAFKSTMTNRALCVGLMICFTGIYVTYYIEKSAGTLSHVE